MLSAEEEADKKAETGRVRNPKFEVFETQDSAHPVARVAHDSRTAVTLTDLDPDARVPPLRPPCRSGEIGRRKGLKIPRA